MASLGDAGVQRPARRARSFVSFGRTGLPSRGFDSSPVVDLLSSAARALQPSAVLCSARHGACSVADPARRELGTVGHSGFEPRTVCCSSYALPSVDPMTRARVFVPKMPTKAVRPPRQSHPKQLILHDHTSSRPSGAPQLPKSTGSDFILSVSPLVLQRISPSSRD